MNIRKSKHPDKKQRLCCIKGIYWQIKSSESESNRKIKRGGLSNIKPKQKTGSSLGWLCPYPTIPNPNLKYLNQVLIQRERWLTN